MTGYPWNFGDLLDATARVVPGERPALIQGARHLSWAAFDARSNRLARRMRAEGLEPGARVAVLARNIPEYIEIAAAAFKARLACVNVNFRYTTAEIQYLMTDSGAALLFHQPEFGPVTAPLAESHPGLRRIEIGPEYEALATLGDGSPLGIPRSGEDPYLVYTGGTTGKPKGVVWHGADARATQLESPAIRRVPRDMADHSAAVAANTAPSRVMPACPLMHGAGITSSLSELVNGGTVVMLPEGPYRATELLDSVERDRVTRILIVGDVFARPIVEALDAEPGRWDTGSLQIISSAGLMWSREVKQALLRHMPQLTLLDVLGASEASSLGYAVTTATQETPTGWFLPGPSTVLIAPDYSHVLPSDRPGEGLIGRFGPTGHHYHGDPEKTAQTYRVIDGIRYAIPGDMAARDAEGRLRLIGRGSQVINSGGEKIFAEEVEEAFKRAPGVRDVIVIGLPDPQWGRIVVALAEVGPGYDEAEARRVMLGDLAPYKLPRRILCLPALPRHPSGKSDYREALRLASEATA